MTDFLTLADSSMLYFRPRSPSHPPRLPPALGRDRRTPTFRSSTRPAPPFGTYLPPRSSQRTTSLLHPPQPSARFATPFFFSNIALERSSDSRPPLSARQLCPSTSICAVESFVRGRPIPQDRRAFTITRMTAQEDPSTRPAARDSPTQRTLPPPPVEASISPRLDHR